LVYSENVVHNTAASRCADARILNQCHAFSTVTTRKQQQQYQNIKIQLIILPQWTVWQYKTFDNWILTIIYNGKRRNFIDFSDGTNTNGGLPSSAVYLMVYPSTCTNNTNRGFLSIKV